LVIRSAARQHRGPTRARRDRVGGRAGAERGNRGGGQFCKARAVEAAGAANVTYVRVIPEELEISLHRSDARARYVR